MDAKLFRAWFTAAAVGAVLFVAPPTQAQFGPGLFDFEPPLAAGARDTARQRAGAQPGSRIGTETITGSSRPGTMDSSRFGPSRTSTLERLGLVGRSGSGASSRLGPRSFESRLESLRAILESNRIASSAGSSPADAGARQPGVSSAGAISVGSTPRPTTSAGSRPAASSAAGFGSGAMFDTDSLFCRPDDFTCY